VKAIRVPALIGSVVFLAILMSPALASGPVSSPTRVQSADAPSISASGVGTVQLSASDPLAAGQTLYIGVQTTAEVAGMQKAADDLLAKLDGIKRAVIAAGVPADGVRMTGFNVHPNMGMFKPGASPAETGQATQVTSLQLHGSLSADVPSIRVLVAAMNAATSSGATTVNANAGKGGPPYGPSQPSAGELATATQSAIANARANAEALAAVGGKKLGEIRSISAQAPMFGCCPPSSGWTVQVTVTFDLAQ
jgi:uncharacterized protein YggE